MSIRTSIGGPALAVALTLAGPAGADFLFLAAELDDLALDGVTPLEDLEGYAGEQVLNVYAVFSNPQDAAVAVIGAPVCPFNVVTCGAGYVNDPSFGADTPPTPQQVAVVHALNWDSFYTIGLKLSGPEDELIVAPGTPGPNPVDAPGGVWGGGNTNMAWSVPGPVPQSLAGPDGRVLLMRLVLPADAPPQIVGDFALLWRDGASGDFLQPCGHVQILFTCPCTGDLNFDGLVDVQDLAQLIQSWGEQGGPADVNDDGVVDVQDLTLLILSWGSCL